VDANRIFRGFARRYLTVDGRSAALCRMALAAFLVVDALGRLPCLRDFYSNDGLLPNYAVLGHAGQEHPFSVFFAASRPGEAAALFVFAFACFVALGVGWHTRLFHVLAFVMAMSLHERDLVAEGTGLGALAALFVWTAFLPLGRRWSADALRASLRAGLRETPADLAERALPPLDARPAVTLAVLGVLAQLVFAYGLRFARSGWMARTGAGVHYALYDPLAVGPLGPWARDHVPFAVTRASTYTAIAIWGAAALLIASPIATGPSRRAAAALLALFHLAASLFARVGDLPSSLVVAVPLLIDGAVWDRWGRTASGRDRRQRVLYDAGCGVCFQIARVAVRLDVLGRLQWIPNDSETDLPRGLDASVLSRTIAVVDPEGGRFWTRGRAVARIVAALPFGRALAACLVAPGVSALVGRAYDAIASRRTALSTWLGYAACATPRVSASALGAPLAPEPPPIRAWLAARAVVARECVAAFVILAFATDPVRVESGRGWTSPQEAPATLSLLTVDAVTWSGRHVDPYREAQGNARLALPEAASHGPAMYRQFAQRLPERTEYQAALTSWVFAYPRRTGRLGDVIVSFRAGTRSYAVPAPGERTMTELGTSTFLVCPER
jgi:predicted DCC family thiol-disulfide oxidoreductase YuxK